MSSASVQLLIISASLPAASGQPIAVKAQTNASQITVTWAASANNGGTAITAYQVYFNQGPITNTFVVYSTVSQATLTETITTVTSGDPYIIRIVTQNRLGSSPASLETTIYAASKPEAPDAPTRVANTFA